MRPRISKRHHLNSFHRCAHAAIESLETRQLLNAAIVVNTTSDTTAVDAFTTLREALTLAQNTAGDDEITFDPTVFDSGSLHTITPQTNPFEIPSAGGKVTITGPGSDVLEIDGSNAGRSFDVDSGATAIITGMTITKGAGKSFGGGIYNQGLLLLNGVVVTKNSVTGSDGPNNPSGAGGAGDDAFGGGIYSTLGLTIQNSFISLNSAIAGNGGTGITVGGVGGAGWGGGIYSSGGLSMFNSTFAGNIADGGNGNTSIADGGAGGSGIGGAVALIGTATMQVFQSAVINNSAGGGGGASGTFGVGGNAGPAFGGGIYIDAQSLSVDQSVITFNVVSGGSANNAGLGGPGTGGAGFGGGLYVNAALSGADNTIASNHATGGVGGAAPGTTNGGTGGAAAGAGLVLGINGNGSFSSTQFLVNQLLPGAGGNAQASNTGGEGGNGLGGAVESTGGDFTFTDCTFDSNVAPGANGGSGGFAGQGADGRGGAIYYNGTGTLHVTGGTISNNSAEGGNDGLSTGGGNAGQGWGGGIAADGTVALSKVTINKNFAGGGSGVGNDSSHGGTAFGGGVQAGDGLSIDQSTISDNAATGGNSKGTVGADAFGGGVFNEPGPFSMSASTVTTNTSNGGISIKGTSGTGSSGGFGAGAGLYLHASSLNITTSTIDHNNAKGGHGSDATTGPGGSGGVGSAAGMYVASSAAIKVTNSTIDANDAIAGDGGQTTDNAHGGNTGFVGGGGIFADDAITLINVTVTGNFADSGSPGTSSGGGAVGQTLDGQGGGLYLDAGGNVINTILSDDLATTEPEIHGSVNVSHSLISNTTGIVFNTDDTNIKNVDPLLGALKDNGGPTFTRVPGSTSQAINHGDDVAAHTEFGQFANDQRGQGFPRFLSVVDIGSVETSGVPAISVSGNAQNISNNDTTPTTSDFTDFGTQFRYAQPLTRTFTVTNTGGAPLDITTVNLPSGYSLVEPLSPTIDAGDSDSFTVALSTATAGTFNGNIVISSNDPNANQFTFAVTGVISPTFRVNFQPDGAPVPEGFIEDDGFVFANRGNGLSYGWNLNATGFARDRNLLSDQAKDTLIHTQLYGTRTWEVSVPNGAYIVHLVAGDAQYFDSNYKINAESSLLVNAKPTSGSRFAEGTMTVVVSDGKLTLSNASGSVNNKFDFVEITPTNAPPPPATIKVNFQTPSSSTPSGYLADTGGIFADRGNGQFYGWDQSATSFTRDRNAGNSPDQKHDTLVHMQLYGVRKWEIAVPTGSYQVHIVAGDPSYTDSVYKINAEGILALSGTPNANNHWIEGTQTVSVADGRLTIENASGSVNNKLDYIEITPV